MAWIIDGSPQTVMEVPEGTPGSTPGPAPAAMPAYTEWLAASLSSYEALAKRLVSHRAEKGRVVESVVKSALRTILPGRFSLGTGFAITASGKCSSQLDIVIYDQLANAPITLEGGTGLFPIECIYGFVEVKSVLDREAIGAAAKAIGAVRRFATEKRYIAYGSVDDGRGNATVAASEFQDVLPPRSFIFAINSSYGDVATVTDALSVDTVEHGAHVHGLAVLDKGWFIAQKPHRHPPEFTYTKGDALPAFCSTVIDTIQSMAMLPASMRRYLGIAR
jgi:hypothetical protein